MNMTTTNPPQPPFVKGGSKEPRCAKVLRLPTTPRACLCCGKSFASQGPHNRLCSTCRAKSVGPYDL